VPPRWADKFLEWYCHPDYVEEIQGDAHQLFSYWIKESGPGVARRKFVWNVIRFFRLSNIKKSSTQNILHMDMLKSYFKVGVRNIYKNKLTSVINIVGLSLAIAFALACYTFLDFQYNADRFHVNHERILQVQNEIERDGRVELWANSPEALGARMKEDFESVESFARLLYASSVMKYEDKVFSEGFYYADPDFLKIFSFNLKWGNNEALINPSNIVLSNDAAVKYFGYQNPLGKQIVLILKNADGADVKESFVVGAVAEKFSNKRSFDFNMLVPYSRRTSIGYEDPDNNWEKSTRATFLLADKAESLPDLEQNMQQYLKIQNEADPEWSISKFMLEPLTTLSRNSYKFRSSISIGGHAGGRIVMVAISLFLLILACFNYMNIAMSSATKR